MSVFHLVAFLFMLLPKPACKDYIFIAIFEQSDRLYCAFYLNLLVGPPGDKDEYG